MKTDTTLSNLAKISRETGEPIWLNFEDGNRAFCGDYQTRGFKWTSARKLTKSGDFTVARQFPGGFALNPTK